MKKQLREFALAGSALVGVYAMIALRIKLPFIIRQRVAEAEKRRGRYTSSEREALRQQLNKLHRGLDPEYQAALLKIAKKCIEGTNQDGPAPAPLPPSSHTRKNDADLPLPL